MTPALSREIAHLFDAGRATFEQRQTVNAALGDAGTREELPEAARRVLDVLAARARP